MVAEAQTWDLVGIGTLALAVATFALAGIALWQLREARQERQATEEGLRIARATLMAEQRPELAPMPERPLDPMDMRPVHLGSYGLGSVHAGITRVNLNLKDGQVGLVSFNVRNLGRGPAQIRGCRLLALETGKDEAVTDRCWVPDRDTHTWPIVPAGEDTPIDLVMTTDKPSWFYGVVGSCSTFWVEMTYADLGAVEPHVRWFEIRHRRATEGWFVAGVLRDKPQFSDAGGLPSFP